MYEKEKSTDSFQKQLRSRSFSSLYFSFPVKSDRRTGFPENPTKVRRPTRLNVRTSVRHFLASPVRSFFLLRTGAWVSERVRFTEKPGKYKKNIPAQFSLFSFQMYKCAFLPRWSKESRDIFFRRKCRTIYEQSEHFYNYKQGSNQTYETLAFSN